MAEPHASEGSSTSNAAAESSDSIVELNIKTLDSQIYNFHVDKNILVSAFKENIASKVGVPVGQQRLIFRGKVLKDSHLLSEYHVDNGHTLHLVVRQPSDQQSLSSTSTGETTNNTGNRGLDPSSGLPRTRVGQVSHSVVLGTFNVGEQGESTVPDISRVIGAVLNSIGIGNHTAMNGSGGLQPTVQFNAPAQAPQGNEAEGRQGASNDQTQAGNQSVFGQTFSGQSMPHLMQIPLGTAIPIPSLNQPIPDSLHTLIEFMNRMELALAQNGNLHNQSENAGDVPAVNLPANSQGVPTPDALGVVLRRAERFLSAHVIDSLSCLAGRMEQEGGSSDPTLRSQIQTESMQLGVVMQHIGTLLLELGRAMLTLRMGQSSAESSVSAGPPVYISSSGPNPIMVQPLNPGTFLAGGVGPIPRHVNIHIHTALGPRATNGEGMQGDHVAGTGAGDSGQARVLPVRNIIAAAVPSRPSVVSVSTAAQRGGGLSQQSTNSVPLSTVMTEVSSQIRSIVDNMRNENQASTAHTERSAVQHQSTMSGADNSQRDNDMRSLLDTIRELPLPSLASQTESVVAQQENQKQSNKDDGDGSVKADLPSSSSSNVADNQSSGETVQKLVEGTDCAPSSNQGPGNAGGATSVPLGLGLGGLQPKRRSRQSNSMNMSGDSATYNAPAVPNERTSWRNEMTLASRQLAPASEGITENMPMQGLGAGHQNDSANVMSQLLHSPALDGLLAGVSQQTGVGSPDLLRNMLGRLTQNPAMMNTVNQIAQQMDSQDFGSMFAGLGSGQSGGLDLSRMVQQMMPIVSQALGSGSTIPRQAASMEREVQATCTEGMLNRDENPNDQHSQFDLQHVVQRLEHEDPPQEVFRSVVESVLSSQDYGSGAEGLNELCTENALVEEFMEVLRSDLSQRVQDDTGPAEES